MHRIALIACVSLASLSAILFFVGWCFPTRICVRESDTGATYIGMSYGDAWIIRYEFKDDKEQARQSVSNEHYTPQSKSWLPKSESGSHWSPGYRYNEFASFCPLYFPFAAFAIWPASRYAWLAFRRRVLLSVALNTMRYFVIAISCAWLGIWAASYRYTIMLGWDWEAGFVYITRGFVYAGHLGTMTGYWHHREGLRVLPHVGAPQYYRGWSPKLWTANREDFTDFILQMPARLTFLVAAPGLLFLLFRRRKRPEPGHCAGCGYNLTGNTSGTCPECGQTTNSPLAAAEPP